jgi:acyl-CoA synthetase (AMP-forming)/AMP-acid ligase II
VIHTSPWPLPDIPAVTLTGLVLGSAARHGDAPALIDGASGETTTYAALAGRVAGAAARLAALGVRPGDVVGLVGLNGPAWVVALHGALAAGATVAPLNPACTVDELAGLLGSAGAVAALVDPAVDDRVEKAAALAGTGLVARLDELTGPAGAELPPPVDPATVAVLPFSSGTTGLPKGVLLTHRNLVANIEQHRELQRLGPGDVLCAVIPFFHSYGLTLVLHAALAHGAAVVTLPRFDLDAYLAAIATHRVTRLHVAPPVLRALAGAPARAEEALASVQVAVCGAAPLDPALAAGITERYGFPVIQGYGLTEAAPGTHFTPDDRWRSVPPGSVGWLVPGTEGRIEPVADDTAGPDDAGPDDAGPDDAGPDDAGTATGERGELWIRGPQVMAGYHDDPEATAATLDAEGWLRTGDVVRVDDDGVFRIVDRVKELIKYKGYQVPPAELEAVVLGHRSVRDVAVVGVPDAVAGELPKAVVVADDDLDADELMAWVAERVAPYKKIRVVERVDAIPRSPAGKILRRLLR